MGGYEALQLSTSLQLLMNLIKTPERFYEHFPRFPASLVFTLSFDKPLPEDGKDLDEVQRVLADFVQDMNPGAHLVDTFPVLDLLPDFLSPYALLVFTKSIDLIGAPGGAQRQGGKALGNLR